MAGIPFSASLQTKCDEPAREVEKTNASQADEIPAEVMMPRKARKLYEAMQVCSWFLLLFDEFSFDIIIVARGNPLCSIAKPLSLCSVFFVVSYSFFACLACLLSPD